MTKLTKQNVAGTDYAMVGCTLTGVSATSADTFLKVISLSDGDIVADGMTVVCTFANGNTAGNAPNPITIYSSDQVHYYSDSGLTQAFTLAPEGCYEITYTGTGNAYEYISYPVFQIGSVTGPLCDAKGHPVGGELWEAGDVVMSTYSGGKFLMASSAAKISEAAERLETARNLKVALGSTTAQPFDGSADATSIGVGGTLPVANGGTGQTAAKGVVDVTIQAGIQDATADVTDTTGIITTHIEGYSTSNKSLYRRPATALWNYIKSKIQSIALTIGSTASAIAETLYGSLTVKNSSGTTTASISQAGAITGASATLSGNVLGSNVPYFGTVYSSNTYSSGYYEIARLEGAAASGNHSISMEGTVISDKTGTVTISDFYVFVRGNNATVSIAIFNCVGRYSNADLTATYEVFDTNKFRIRLYGKITGNYHRYNTVIKYASTGDVSDRASNRTVTFPNAYVTTVVGTSITKNVNYAGNVTGSSGSCSGNSATADTTRGTAYCTTAGTEQAKVASMRGFVLQSGATFPITFTNANSYNGVITLNVNSTGAKNIYINNAVTSSSNKTLPAGTYLCRYNGSYYYIDTGYFVTNARYADSCYSADISLVCDSANTAGVAKKIRASAVSSPSDGDIWIE